MKIACWTSGDDVDEVSNLLGDGSLVTLQTGGQTSNPAHDSVVADIDDHSDTSSLHGVSREEADVLSFQRIVMSELWSSHLRLRLSGQGGIVHFEPPGLQHPADQ